MIPVFLYNFFFCERWIQSTRNYIDWCPAHRKSPAVKNEEKKKPVGINVLFTHITQTIKNNTQKQQHANNPTTKNQLRSFCRFVFFFFCGISNVHKMLPINFVVVGDCLLVVVLFFLFLKNGTDKGPTLCRWSTFESHREDWQSSTTTTAKNDFHEEGNWRFFFFFFWDPKREEKKKIILDELRGLEEKWFSKEQIYQPHRQRH